MSVRWFWFAISIAFAACGGGGGGGSDPGGSVDVLETPAPDTDGTKDIAGAETAADLETAAEQGVLDGSTSDLDPGGMDVDWSSLPRLPAGRSFQTRYAAAAAVRDITPDHDVFMGGFGFCGGDEKLCRKSEVVHDPLKVAVAAIADTKTGEVVIFAGVDSVGLFLWDMRLMHEAVQRRLYEEYGVYFEGTRLMIGASHSHAAPDTAGLWGPMFGVPRDEAYIGYLRDQTVAAAAEAFGALEDATLTWAKGSSPNATDGSEPVVKDEDLFVVRATRPDGSPIFTLSRWSSHPTAYGSRNNGLSSDWVGPFRKRMEAEFGGIAVFLNGAVGGTYPDRPVECGLAEEDFPDGWKDPDLSADDFMKVTCTGHEVAENAILAMQEPKPVAETGVEFHHSLFGFYPSNATLLLAAQVAQVPFAWGDPDALLSDDPPDMHTEFSLARVGDLTFLTAPGEAFPAFAESAKAVLAEAGLPNPIVLGLTQDWLGYLLTEEQWKDQKLSYHQGLSPGKKVLPAYLEKLREILGLSVSGARTGS